MPRGAAGTDKAAAEQGLLDEVLAQYPHVLARDQVWLLDRLWHGVRRIAALTQRTHVLIRVKSDITLKRVSEILPDGSYRAQLSGDGLTITVRVTGYFVDVEGQKVPEMFSPTFSTGKSTLPGNSPDSISGGGTGPRPGCARRRPRCTGPGRAPGRCSAPAARGSSPRKSRPGRPPPR